MRNIIGRREQGDRGFTLIELLVVMIIIGILSAIAIPTFLNQRKNGWRTAMKSDLKTASIGAEGWSVQNGNGTFLGLDDAVLSSMLGGVATADVTVTVVATGTSGFCLQATNTNLPGETLWFDSLAGTPTTVDCSASIY